MIQRWRVPLGFVLAAAVLYLATPTKQSLAVGLPVALAGAVIRGLAAGTIRKDSSLAREGLYGWTRNPLYLGSVLLTAGFAVMSWSIPAAVLLGVPSLLIYPNVIRNEEAHLERLFPAEFGTYRSQVARFLPATLPRPGKWFRAFSAGRYIANREYNTALGFAVILVVFIAKCG